MRKVYCPKHGEDTSDLQIEVCGKWSKPFCIKCIVEWLEKNVNICEIKEEFENENDPGRVQQIET